MTISLPISLSVQSSNVTDNTPSIEDLLLDCIAPVFSDGLEVRDTETIYSYKGEEFTPQVWNQNSADRGEYEVDDILLKDCKLIKVTGKEGDGIYTKRRPLEPEEYGAWDRNMDYANWSHRYVRLDAVTAIGWCTKTWLSPSRKRLYYMYWECNGNTSCGSEGAWRWTAKDMNAFSGNPYLTTCLKDHHTKKFVSASDIKATIPVWSSTGCNGACPKEGTVQFKSLIERGGYFYFRTHLNIPVKYATWIAGVASKYTYSDVVSPADIEGFIERRKINSLQPFDGKSYTKAIVDTTATDYKAVWTVLSARAFDTIAFSRMICDSIDVKFMDIDGNLIDELNTYEVDNTVANNSDVEHYATAVLYSGRLYSNETVIQITLNGSHVEIGELIAGERLDAGFTKSAFQNKLKDFSPKEQDDWGNWHYIDGVKVRVHAGTVDFPVASYDKLNRLMVLIGGSKVIINSSDSIMNEPPDGKNVFESTMMIGRFTSLDLSTTNKSKEVDDIGSYKFNIEELV